MNKFNLKKGLDIPIAGIPKQVVEESKIPNSVAILGPDYNGLKPKMFVNILIDNFPSNLNFEK